MPAEPSPTTPATAAVAAPALSPKIAGALARYRIAALVVGFGLILLCITIALKYFSGVEANGKHALDWTVAIWGPIHGALYVIYVLLAFDLAYKDRWTLLGTLYVLLAGVVPGVSFVAERMVHRKVLARQKI